MKKLITLCLLPLCLLASDDLQKFKCKKQLQLHLQNKFFENLNLSIENQGIDIELKYFGKYEAYLEIWQHLEETFE